MDESTTMGAVETADSEQYPYEAEGQDTAAAEAEQAYEAEQGEGEQAADGQAWDADLGVTELSDGAARALGLIGDAEPDGDESGEPDVEVTEVDPEAVPVEDTPLPGDQPSNVVALDFGGPGEDDDEPLTDPARTTALLQLDLPELHESEHNPRADYGDLDELADSIEARGLVEPLVVQARPEGGYTIIAGHRRVRAATLVVERGGKLGPLPAVLREGGDDAGTEADRLVENLHRADLAPLEEAQAFRRLITEHGYTGASVARLIGKNQGHVSKRLALLDLTPAAQEAVTSGRLKLNDAVTLARAEPDEQDAVLERVAPTAPVPEHVRPAVSAETALAAERRKREAEEQRAEARRLLVEAGHTVIDTPAGGFYYDSNPRAVDPGNLTRWGITEAEHDTAECAVYAITAHPRTRPGPPYGQIEELPERFAMKACTNPSAHEQAVRDAQQAARQAEEAAQEAARAARQAAYEAELTAWDARQEFIVGLLQGKAPKGAADYLNRTTVLDGALNDPMLWPTHDRYEQAQEWLDRGDLVEVAAKGKGDALMRWALALRLACIELALAPVKPGAYNDHAEAQSSPVVRAHLDWLKASGHTLTEPEQRLYERAETLPVWLFGDPDAEADEDRDPENSRGNGAPIFGAAAVMAEYEARLAAYQQAGEGDGGEDATPGIEDVHLPEDDVTPAPEGDPLESIA